MTKNQFLATIMVFFSAINISNACDACGCSMSQVYWGILPNQSNHYLGLWWQYQRYGSFSGSSFEELADQNSTEQFNLIELRGRFNISPRWKLFGIVPYAHHIRERDGEEVILNGLGDITLMAHYQVFNTADSLQKTVRHSFAAGAGLKLPTGSFQEIADEESFANPYFQVGTGSWDFLFNLVYTLRWRQLGLNADLTYKLNTNNQNDYRFGNRFNGALTFFHFSKLNQIQIMPNTGLFVEQAEWDVREGFYRTHTGGEALFANFGLEVYYKQFNFGANYNHPLYADWSNGYLAPESRFSIHFNVFF